MTSESPIVQIPELDESYNELIYQQQQSDNDSEDNHDNIPQTLKLDLRGTHIELDRDILVNLPESLLMAMFPNGLILPQEEDDDGLSLHSLGIDQIYQVDVDPACLDYVLEFYRQAVQIRDQQHQDPSFHQLLQTAANSPVYYTLLTKQPIIVLREELEYFCIPTKDRKNQVNYLKRASGEYLEQQASIFEPLQKNISRENNVAEQHLIDMLCDAGFNRDGRWGYRKAEPTKTIIVSMAMVSLETIGSENHMATAQKLFSFWRKPARKCWWDGNTVDIKEEAIRLWSRRSWTLELALV